MDKVAEGLYVGSLHTLSSPRDLENHNITHVISLLRDNVKDMSEYGFHHLHVKIDDDDEEDIMKYFAETNRFIEQARAQGNGVLVHCIAGISRSVTVAVAYLLKKAYTEAATPEVRKKLSVEGVIRQVKLSRSIANPNPSFREQLGIYLAEGCTVNPKNPLYAAWIKRKQDEGIPLTGKLEETLTLAKHDDSPRKYVIGDSIDDLEIKPRL